MVMVVVMAAVHVRGVGPQVHVVHVAVGRAHLRSQRVGPGLRRGRCGGGASLVQPVARPGAGVGGREAARGCRDLEVRMNAPQTGCGWGLVRAGPKGSRETSPLA